MSTLFPSALINAMSGLLKDFIYYKRRGVDYIKAAPTSVAHPPTARAIQIRNNFGTLAAAYPDLPTSYRQLWDQFNIMSGRHGEGRNAYIRLNGNLLNASHDDLTAVSHPPHTPATPKHIMGFCVHQVNKSTVCLSWTKPDDDQTYVTGHFKLHFGFCGNFPCYGLCPTEPYGRTWRFVKTERADQFAIQHIHQWPLDTRLFYRLNSIDTSGRKSPFSHAIETRTPFERYIYLCDKENDRIKKHLTANLSYVAKIGSWGTGNDNFDVPGGIAADSQHLYVSDTMNYRIVKRLKSNLAYVDEIGSEGSGDDQFGQPLGIAVDTKYIYIADTNNDRIVKRLKSDLSFVAKFGEAGDGDDQFQSLSDIAVDNNYLYIIDTMNHRIKKHLKSDLSYVAKFGSSGDGDDQFFWPRGIAIDNTHIYIGDQSNHRIKKHLKSDLSYVSKIGTEGDGDDQFWYPWGIALDNKYLYICDQNNDRIQKRLISDLSYVAKFGSSGDGDDQFENPRGIATQTKFC